MWLDQLDIVPGQRWDRGVEDALATCPRMLVILSPASVNSTNVMDEVSFALEEKKTVIPLIYKDCSVPFRLRRVQYVDIRQDYARGLKELLKTLAHEQKLGQSAPASSHLPSHRRTDVMEADERERAASLEVGRRRRSARKPSGHESSKSAREQLNRRDWSKRTGPASFNCRLVKPQLIATRVDRPASCRPLSSGKGKTSRIPLRAAGLCMSRMTPMLPSRSNR